MTVDRSLLYGGLGWPLAAFLVAIFVFNLATIQMFPIVWQDEVMSRSRRRIGCVMASSSRGHGFFNRETNIWAGNSPLYTVLVTPWLKGLALPSRHYLTKCAQTANRSRSQMGERATGQLRHPPAPASNGVQPSPCAKNVSGYRRLYAADSHRQRVRTVFRRGVRRSFGY